MEGQVLGKEGVMMIWTRKEPWQNKANFLRVGESSIPSFHYSSPGPIMRNKAKLGQDGTSGKIARRRGRWCETNPISGGRDTPPFHYSTIPILCLSYETKPIPPGIGVQGSAVRHLIPGPCPPGFRAKQSQFPICRRTSWLTYPPPYAGRTPSANVGN